MYRNFLRATRLKYALSVYSRGKGADEFLLVKVPLSRQETGLWRVVPLVSASIALVQVSQSSDCISETEF